MGTDRGSNRLCYSSSVLLLKDDSHDCGHDCGHDKAKGGVAEERRTAGGTQASNRRLPHVSSRPAARRQLYTPSTHTTQKHAHVCSSGGWGAMRAAAAMRGAAAAACLVLHILTGCC